MNIIAAVDCYKVSHAVAFLDESRRLVDELTIANSPEGFDEAIACASRLAESVSWGLESVGSHGRSFAKYLLDRGASVFDVPSASPKRCGKRAARHRRSDEIDTRAIAEVRLFDDCRERLVEDRSQVMNRMRHTARRLGVNVPKGPYRPQALAGLRAHLNRIEVGSDVSQALVTDLRFGARTIEVLNEQIAEVERSLDPFVSHLFHETPS